MQLLSNPETPQLVLASEIEKSLHLKDLLPDEARAKSLQFFFEDMQVDLSRQRLSLETLGKLQNLAKAAEVEEKRDQMLSGQSVNFSENRPVIHTQSRAEARFASAEWQELAAFVEQVRHEGKFCTVLNIGIGGSDLGPTLVSQGLQPYEDGPVAVYVSNIDPSHINDTLKQCDPATTLVVVTSKSFTTPETLANAELARGWLIAAGIDPASSMVAVTARKERAIEAGYQFIFPFEEGVCGRFSLWSAVGLPVMLGIGVGRFQEFLTGARAMDRHFAESAMHENIPILLALIRVWNRDFLRLPSQAIMPYDQRLARLPAWAQQLEMESNGKSVDIDGNFLAMPASTLIWGEAGSNGQHSFFQGLHQGREVIPIDVLLPRQPLPADLSGDWQENHRILAMNAVAQAETLAYGKEDYTAPHRHHPGNRPSSVISWRQTTPYALGRLLALYEHVTVVYGFIHHINSFDQWGVELGKKVATELITGVGQQKISSSARDLINRINQGE